MHSVIFLMVLFKKTDGAHIPEILCKLELMNTYPAACNVRTTDGFLCYPILIIMTSSLVVYVHNIIIVVVSSSQFGTNSVISPSACTRAAYL